MRFSIPILPLCPHLLKQLINKQKTDVDSYNLSGIHIHFIPLFR